MIAAQDVAQYCTHLTASLSRFGKQDLHVVLHVCASCRADIDCVFWAELVYAAKAKLLNALQGQSVVLSPDRSSLILPLQLGPESHLSAGVASCQCLSPQLWP